MAYHRAGRASDTNTPMLDRRLERFVERYLDSPLKLDLVRTLGQRPNRAYEIDELAHLIGFDALAVERAAFYLERLGIVKKRNGRDASVSLARAPVMRDSAIALFRHSTRPGGYDQLRRVVRNKNASSRGDELPDVAADKADPLPHTHRFGGPALWAATDAARGES